MAAKQILKYLPFAGQAAAAALSGAAMMYVGNAHVDECYEIAKKPLRKQQNTLRNNCAQPDAQEGRLIRSNHSLDKVYPRGYGLSC